MAFWIRRTPVAGKAESAEAQLTTPTVRRPCGFFLQTRVVPTVCPKFASRMPEKPNLSGSLSSSPRRTNSSCRVVPECFCASKNGRSRHAREVERSGERVGTLFARVAYAERGPGASLGPSGLCFRAPDKRNRGRTYQSPRFHRKYAGKTFEHSEW